MSGLVLKDLYLAKTQAKMYVLLMVFYSVLSFVGTIDSSLVSGFTTLAVLLLPVTTFSFDDIAHWDKYAAALPTGRRGLVRGKYLFVLCIMGCAMAFVSAVTAVLCLVKGEAAQIPNMLLATLLCGLVGLMMNSILLPLVFRFGAEKSRLLMTAGFIIIFVGIMGGASYLKQHGMTLPTTPDWLLYALPVLAICLVTAFLYGSYVISLHIFVKKEL